MSRIRISAIAILALAAGCTGALATDLQAGPEAGTYVLESVNGQPSPAMIDSSDGDRAVIDADTLTLDGLGGAVRGRTVERTITSFGTQTYRDHYTQEYRLTGASIEVGVFHCPPGAACVQNEHGAIDGEHITLAYPGFPVERFVRVATRRA